jgi:tetratricopeptide (TPR) repeat protein
MTRGATEFRRDPPRPTHRMGWRGRGAGAVGSAIVAMMLLSIGPPLRAADTWREVKSDNFTVITDASERRARNVVWQFEQVRSAIGKAWPWARVVLDRPVFVIAVKDEESMRRMTPEYWEARNRTRPSAVFVTGRDRHYVALRADVEVEEQGMNPYSTAFWSYSALVLENSFKRDLPAWLTNGLSSVLSNTIIKEKEVQFGKPIPWLVELANNRARLPLAELLAVTRDSPYYRQSDSRQQFDAQSWALVQYMLFGSKDLDTKLNQVAKLLIGGTASDAAIKEVYGSLETLDKAAQLYLQQGVFRYMRMLVESDTSALKIPVRVLSAAESAAARAAFHVAMGRPVEARLLLAEAREADAAAPAADDVEGMLLDREQKSAEAQVAFGKAVSAGSTNFWTHYRLTTLAPPQGRGPEALRTAAGHVERAATLNPNYPFAFAYLASLRAALDEHEQAIQAAIRAVALDPADVTSRLVAARCLGHLSRQGDAIAIAREALRLARTDQERRSAQSLLSILGDGK